METLTELLGSPPVLRQAEPQRGGTHRGCTYSVHLAEGDRIFDEGELPASFT